MRRALALGLAAAGLAVTASAPAQQARDWTKAVAATPEGGYRIGNPAAAVKLVEYGSLTCDHCAHFDAEATKPLLDRYVKGGRVSYEFRNFVRDPADLTAALLTRCAGTSGFFPLTHRYFASQAQWMGKIQAGREAINALPPPQRLARAAALGGLDTMAAQSGVTAAKAKTCLADRAAADKLAEIRKMAVERDKLEGTPTFLINGKKAAAHDWATLEPLLKAAGG